MAGQFNLNAFPINMLYADVDVIQKQWVGAQLINAQFYNVQHEPGWWVWSLELTCFSGGTGGQTPLIQFQAGATYVRAWWVNEWAGIVKSCGLAPFHTVAGIKPNIVISTPSGFPVGTTVGINFQLTKVADFNT